MKYGDLNLGQIEAIVNKLGGMNGVRHFLSGRLVVNVPKCDFSVWKTIKLGTNLKNPEDFRCALHNAKFNLDDLASGMLEKPAFTVATEETEVDLIKTSAAELDFKNGARRDQIYECVKGFGLEPCPSEVGPQLRLQYRDQPNHERILVAIEPILDFVGNPMVFSVERNDYGLWLVGRWSSPALFWPTDDQWVFRRPRK